MPPGAAVPVQGVPPMSDITAGMPGLDFMERGIGEKPDQKGSSSSSASVTLAPSPNPNPNPNPSPYPSPNPKP